jgi:structural maintenance of chromosome 1
VKAEDDIRASEEGIAELREELKELQETLDEKSKIVDQVKKTTLKASKVLDQALKEIATCVSFNVVWRTLESFSDVALQNDEIEKLALERSALYRKCRLEEIQLPLLEGDLRHVPMEEVRCLFYSLLDVGVKRFGFRI